MNWLGILERIGFFSPIVSGIIYVLLILPWTGCRLGVFLLWGKAEGVRMCWGCGRQAWPNRRLFGRKS